MIANITNSAKSKLDELKNNSEEKYLRIKLLDFTSCGILNFTIEPSDIKEDDKHFNIQGYDFIIAKDIYEIYTRFSMDYVPDGLYKGFIIKGYRKDWYKKGV